MKNPLFEYFEQNWNRKPHPVTDHWIRVDKLPDGTFHFYIHPTYVDGITTDFIVSPDATKIRE